MICNCPRLQEKFRGKPGPFKYLGREEGLVFLHCVVTYCAHSMVEFNATLHLVVGAYSQEGTSPSQQGRREVDNIEQLELFITYNGFDMNHDQHNCS
jgi:hypothetical protein